MDIYTRLEKDHEKQRRLSDQLLETTGDSPERKRLFEALKTEIEAHAAAEEQTFYAELISHADGQEQARHSVAEHKEAADLLEELTDADMASGGWLTKFKTLKHDLEHHMDEEEADVFDLARSLISDEQAKKLAANFEEQKAEH